MKRAWAFLVIATIAGSPVWAQQKIDQIVARVNGDIILKSEIDRELDLRRIEMAQQGMDPARINQELAEQSKDCTSAISSIGHSSCRLRKKRA